MTSLASRIGSKRRLLPVAILTLVLTGCQTGLAASQPSVPTATAVAVASKVVWAGTYARNIQPIFDQRCTNCHGPSRAENGLRLDSYQGVMKGTQHGPVIVAGSPGQSALVSVVKGEADPQIRMPHEGQRVTQQELQNLTLWIEAGAKEQ